MGTVAFGRSMTCPRSGRFWDRSRTSSTLDPRSARYRHAWLSGRGSGSCPPEVVNIITIDRKVFTSLFLRIFFEWLVSSRCTVCPIMDGDKPDTMFEQSLMIWPYWQRG